VHHTAHAAPGLWDALRGTGQRRELVELLDLPGNDPRTLGQNLAHLRLLNRWLGWSVAIDRDLTALMRRHGLRSATVLDIATGSADIPRELARRASHHDTNLRLIATDVSRSVLAHARSTGLTLVQHDGATLPFRDNSADYVLCNLAAHHFPPEPLRAALGEMWRVARHAVLVNDLTRGRLSYVLARLMALVLRNPLTSHDGPVSVLRAYTPAELRSLGREAGMQRIRVRTFFPARMTLVAEKAAVQ
jgi:ubiquinone/menaquinone biosynthesis C-methylase UbiE